MPEEYALEIRREGAFLRITVAGARSLERSERLFARVRAEALAQGYRQVLIDATALTGELALAYRFRLGETAAALFGGTRIRLAALIRPEVGGAPFTETVARNRGADYRVFHGESPALRWLTSGPPPEPGHTGELRPG
jgi:hypothetical protein